MTTTDMTTPHRYSAAYAGDIEQRWQERWDAAHAFRALNPGDDGFDPTQPKYYCLDMFPYPSGAGLHVGHPEGYIATDILCRFRRLNGFNVLHPMGWDAFGLPAEQYAIRTGVHPAKTTRTAIDTFRRQLKRFGFSYDWSREFATIDEDYYGWTQWIWLKAYGAWFDVETNRARPIDELTADLDAGRRHINTDGGVDASGEDTVKWADFDADQRRDFIDGQRLAYLGEQTVNWCPQLGTALANEEVIDGRSERGDFPVYRKPLKQWMFRITAYTERLLENLDRMKWPNSTRTMQREWIGRSVGAEVDFVIADPPENAPGEAMTSIRVFTTRPDTLFGATYMVLAPEHPLVEAMLAAPRAASDVAAIRAYVEEARNRSDVNRMADTDTKTGVATGFDAVNPATGEHIPIWIADYVLMGYGHGAIMAVPAHDTRDYAFARTFELSIRDVVETAALRAVRLGALRLDRSLPHDDQLKMLGAFVDRASSIALQADPSAVAAQADAIHERVEMGVAAPGPLPEVWVETIESMVTASPFATGDRERDFGAFIDAAVGGRLADWLGDAITEPGVAVNSSNADVRLDGLATDAAKKAVATWLRTAGIGRATTTYKLRDWLFSRQRYWGEPFPIVTGPDGRHYPVGVDALPVALPELTDYEPEVSDEPKPLLAKASDWVHTTAGEAGVDPALLAPDTPVTRETNTMPGWAGSCWYYLRYCSPQFSARFVDREAERYWMLSDRGGVADNNGASTQFDPDRHHIGGVDLYVGGAEHAVLHLLYARFWHMMLFDLGEVSTPEPFGTLFHQGMITSFAYQRANKGLVPIDEVETQTTDAGETRFVETATGEAVTQIVTKMSKSLRNVINPDDVIEEYGADTFRLYEMYMGPLEASKPWNTQDIQGPHRFLQRLWRLVIDESTGDVLAVDDAAADAELEKLLHRMIDKVAGDIDRMAFNTAIAAMIEFVNAAIKKAGAGTAALTKSQISRIAIVLSPFAPHMAEEINARLGNDELVMRQVWPEVDAAMLADDAVEIPVQIKGKVRGRITVPADADPKTTESIALADPKIIEALAGQTVRKVIVVHGRIVNIITG